MECVAVPSVLDEIDAAVENGLPPLNENEEDMKLSAQDKKELKDEIHLAVQESFTNELRAIVDSRVDEKISGSLRFKFWPILANVGVIAIVVAIIVSAFGFVLTEHQSATNRIGDEAKFEQKTSDRLDAIETKLNTIAATQTKQSLETHASLPLDKTSLPDLHTALIAAQQEKIQVSQNVADDLSTKLGAISTADKRDPLFWPVAGELITYRSQLLQSSFSGWSQWPECPHLVAVTGSMHGSVNNCVMSLDGITLVDDDCVHCVVRYAGGSVSLHNVHFVDCLFVFEIPVRRELPPAGQELGEQLLQADLANVQVTSPS